MLFAMGIAKGVVVMKAFLAPLALLIAVPAFAQPMAAVAPASPPAPTQIAIIQPSATDNILRAGTEVPLLVREELTTKKKQLRVGQRIQMEVASAVSQNGVTIIPTGTPAVGEITEVRNKGMWGKSGYIGARVLSLRLGNRHVRLTGTFDDKGVTGTGGVVAAVAFVPIAGFFTTGTSAFIASGSATKGFLDEDIVFRTVAAPAPVLEVPAATVAPAAPATPSIVPASITTTP